ncbi:MmcQ/YjbR family DNA-binding protein [Flavobacterium hydatis]|uniref:MmcQ-like protein n=1 Tax=Flavobacterium hydatis TaxID=991 RepID=A0A086AF11_FLAHY|nr:MmcQ/YjbR family DNA-binding protein [Flavobacterium hydatis]KFF15275.1 hypothetical protein IW20_15075 [Flavobacterium hydatis]OXA93043.1 hypothetical protein B0A62_14510 [Flavobacterium hydatis]
MVSIDEFRKLALSFSEATEEPHFEKTSFRVKKKIFATLDVNKNLGVLKFNEIEQSVFCASSEKFFYPVPNKWGQQGWTIVDLVKVPESMLQDALSVSYYNVLPKKR